MRGKLGENVGFQTDGRCRHESANPGVVRQRRRGDISGDVESNCGHTSTPDGEVVRRVCRFRVSQSPSPLLWSQPPWRAQARELEEFEGGFPSIWINVQNTHLYANLIQAARHEGTMGWLYVTGLVGVVRNSDRKYAWVSLCWKEWKCGWWCRADRHRRHSAVEPPSWSWGSWSTRGTRMSRGRSAQGLKKGTLAGIAPGRGRLVQAAGAPFFSFICAVRFEIFNTVRAWFVKIWRCQWMCWMSRATCGYAASAQ